MLILWNWGEIFLSYKKIRQHWMNSLWTQPLPFFGSFLCTKIKYSWYVLILSWDISLLMMLKESQLNYLHSTITVLSLYKQIFPISLIFFFSYWLQYFSLNFIAWNNYLCIICYFWPLYFFISLITSSLSFSLVFASALLLLLFVK